jgi:superfamily II DNA/RNA helicase
MSTSFADLGLSADLVNLLADRGIAAPFPIQAEAIPPALAGRDVCGRAPTGSGKTLAFGLALVERVGRSKPKSPAALVLAPTRELAAQIQRELAPLLKTRGRRVAAVYGGTAMQPQIKLMRQGVDVLVACPGRLADLIERGVVRLDRVRQVVVDEADRMADMGFLPEVRRLLDQTAPDRQTLLFSATLDGAVDVLIRDYQSDPVRCDVTPEDDGEDLRSHLFLDSDRQDRVAKTLELVREHGQSVVFCRTRRGADRLATALTKAGLTVAPIHGGRSQSQRDRALGAFASGRVEALVATDVAARGIHVDGVDCVVHFDLPADVKDYVHRSGRTGRAGASGVVVSLVTAEDRSTARILRRHLGLERGPQPSRGNQGRPGRRANASRNRNRNRAGGGARRR